jgi:transposase
MRSYYVGMDVHTASIVITVLNGAGKQVMQSIIETKTERVRAFVKQLHGKVQVAFEEGTQASWLYDVLRPMVALVVVCDPRQNKLLQSGNKNDRVDSKKLAELLRNGSLRAVYHGDKGMRTLKELVRHYDCVTCDTTRVMLRLKAIFRGRAIKCVGHGVYRKEQEAQWLSKLDEPVRQRAKFLYEQLGMLQKMRHEAKRAMIKEARRHEAYKLLMSVPQLGPVRVAEILAIVETPFRFTHKRKFWTYIGLAVVTHTSAEYEVMNDGKYKRVRTVATRGLNRNHNHLLKKVFKSAATAACAEGPFKAVYEARLKQGMDASLAKLIIARKLATTTLSIWKRCEQFAPERIKPVA